jgi:hypothetical protein
MATVMPTFTPGEAQETPVLHKPRLADHLAGVWSRLVIAEVQRTIVSEESALSYRFVSPTSYPYGELISKDAYEALSPEDKSTTLVTSSDFHGFATIKGLAGGEGDPRLEKTATFNPKGADELVLTRFQTRSDMDAWAFGKFQDLGTPYPKGLPRRGQLVAGFVNQSRKNSTRYHFYKWFVVSQQFITLWNAVITKTPPEIPALRCRTDIDAPEYRPWSLNARRWLVHNLELGALAYPLRSTYLLIWAFVARALGLPFKAFEGDPLWVWLEKRFT